MTGRPFKTIKLKKKPAGPARTFPSEIRTVQAAIAFVKSLKPKTGPNCIGDWRNRPWLHLILALLGKVLTTVRTGQCATLWPPSAGWPTEWPYAQQREEKKWAWFVCELVLLASNRKDS